jgi:potassium-transporting ATPase potassium-binding subunit
MTTEWLQVLLYIGLLLLLVKPLGAYMARVYQGERTSLDPLLKQLERWAYRLGGIDPQSEMDWKAYAAAMLVFNLAGLLALYALLRLQHFLPLNPQGIRALPPDTAFNAAASFASNTNWQSYSGEAMLSYLSQMLGMGVQNFLSAATGMAVLVALVRGLARQSQSKIGNFWVDLVRGTLYILLPLSFILALVLVSQGVVQTFRPYPQAALLEPLRLPDGALVTNQTLAVGPAASQVAIKQLGTNGGGFFNANSAHPFENPTPLTNFLEALAILLIPAALTHTFGVMIGDVRQGRGLLAVMGIIFLGMLALAIWAELGGNPQLAQMGVNQQPGQVQPAAAGGQNTPDQTAAIDQPGGNMEGKELRIGPVASALWAAATTAASNGSVNSMHDSYTPLGCTVPLVLILFGEVIFGGVGSGLYGLLAFVIVAVFVAGLMVGRTPEYLGKKVEAFEMKMASLMILIPLALVLLGAALAVSVPAAKAAVLNPGPHGFSEILYAFASAGNNNGSAFAGLNANIPFYNIVLGLVMLFARYWLAVPALAIAGSLAGKKKAPAGAGTLPTHTPLFVAWLVAVVILVGVLTFLPALALGPIAEQLLMAAGGVG